MAMVDLKRTEAEKRKRYGIADNEPLPDYYREDYPYGLTLSLDSEEMDKLNIGDMAAGTEMTMSIQVRVTNVGSSEVDGKVRRSMSMQVQGMDIPAMTKPASSLYGEG